MNLYRVKVTARTTNDHPVFADVHGLLILWMWGETSDVVGEKAAAIISCLPYDPIEPMEGKFTAAITLEPSETPSDLQHAAYIKTAREFGFAFCFFALVGDENNDPDSL